MSSDNFVVIMAPGVILMQVKIARLLIMSAFFRECFDNDYVESLYTCNKEHSFLPFLCYRQQNKLIICAWGILIFLLNTG